MATFTGTSGPDTADATTGALVGFTGGTGAELIDSEGDVFVGLAGDDSVKAGSGNDRIRGGLGADLINGGAGTDTVDYFDNFGSVFVNLDIGQGFGNAAQGDTYVSIENVLGSIYNDFIIGNAGSNVLDGGQGNDYLIGSLGADTLIGGSGFDTASYEENAGAIFINMRTGLGFGNAAQGDTLSGIEAIVGTSYGDYLISASSGSFASSPTPQVKTRIDAGGGNDYVISGDGADILEGGAGEDTVSFELHNTVQGGSRTGIYVNLAEGIAYNNNSSSGSIENSLRNADTLSGCENIVGSPNADVLIGDDKSNVLFGKFGDDSLFGGEGRDSFVFDTSLTASGPNVDRIQDFTEIDYIYLDRSTVFSALPFGTLSASAFVTGTAAQDADDRIIYNQATGALFYDADGVGGAAQVQFAILVGSPPVVAEQFFVSG